MFLPGEAQGPGSLGAAVSGVAQSRTRLSDFTFTFHFHALEKEMAEYLCNTVLNSAYSVADYFLRTL